MRPDLFHSAYLPDDAAHYKAWLVMYSALWAALGPGAGQDLTEHLATPQVDGDLPRPRLSHREAIVATLIVMTWQNPLSREEIETCVDKGWKLGLQRRLPILSGFGEELRSLMAGHLDEMESARRVGVVPDLGLAEQRSLIEQMYGLSTQEIAARVSDVIVTEERVIRKVADLLSEQAEVLGEWYSPEGEDRE